MELTPVVSPKSLSRVHDPEPAVIKVAAVQISHNEDFATHLEAVIAAFGMAAKAGAAIT
jgi:hypothetical protein